MFNEPNENMSNNSTKQMFYRSKILEPAYLSGVDLTKFVSSSTIDETPKIPTHTYLLPNVPLSGVSYSNGPHLISSLDDTPSEAVRTTCLGCIAHDDVVHHRGKDHSIKQVGQSLHHPSPPRSSPSWEPSWRYSLGLMSKKLTGGVESPACACGTRAPSPPCS